VAPREGKTGGAFCMSFVEDRSLVLLNWNGSFDSAQTTAHELGHAYHNTQLSQRTPLQRRLQQRASRYESTRPSVPDPATPERIHA
jgi:oligoendopeptidase F